MRVQYDVATFYKAENNWGTRDGEARERDGQWHITLSRAVTGYIDQTRFTVKTRDEAIEAVNYHVKEG